MKLEVIAHVCKNEDDRWKTPQLLDDHLRKTAELSSMFAKKFHSSEWGEALGLLHDVGKSSPTWQEYIRLKSGYGYNEEAHLENKIGTTPHAIHGAVVSNKKFSKMIATILSYCIAGHHVGLQDFSSEFTGLRSLEYQLSLETDINQLDQNILKLFDKIDIKSPPWKFSKGLDASLWIRMLYSCLVDADFLDTEHYMNPSKSLLRNQYQPLSILDERLTNHILNLQNDSPKTKVNSIRADVLNKCLQASELPQGFFSLTVPTGGGKTLSSLAFALKHAIKHNLDRVIYVVPYTSIIEQNALVFQKALGYDQVVEHHSNIVDDETTPQLRISSDNWDAPIIVTTNVQFFESLFASKSSRCRKLHNIANAVIILDEAQLIPIEYMQPILETMKLLVKRYGVSFVISTATQPAFSPAEKTEDFNFGLEDVHEIMGDNEDINKLYSNLRRVDVQIQTNAERPTSFDDIAKELSSYDQVLCIVSTRRSCRELFQLMPDQTYHLSTYMCSSHRSNTIQKIKKQLSNHQIVRVVSTQLVEAGVDFDFPVVYREFSGLDSIAQAAGRCNREGKMEVGTMKIFKSPYPPPVGILRKAAEATAKLLKTHPNEDVLQHSLFLDFFEDLYWRMGNFDKHSIYEHLNPSRNDIGIYFSTASSNFNMINDFNRKTILVPYKKGGDLIEDLRKIGPDRFLLRKLQRYSVSIYQFEFDKMQQRRLTEEIYPGIYTLVQSSDYSDDVGLIIDNELEELIF
ncbi:MAG: CRISPR-associated helicase Cas3' [Caldisericia bacterium]|nr:CRISPR-associated helicase Cas3' [Caldisericia bacterium]